MSAIKEAMIMMEELDEYLTPEWVPVGDFARRVKANGGYATVSVERLPTGELAYSVVATERSASLGGPFIGFDSPSVIARELSARGLPVSSHV